MKISIIKSIFLVFSLLYATICIGQSSTIEYQTIKEQSITSLFVKPIKNKSIKFDTSLGKTGMILVKIEVQSESFPTPILTTMLEQDDFDLKYEASDGQLIIENPKSSLHVRFKGKDHHIDISYTIFIAKDIQHN